MNSDIVARAGLLVDAGRPAEAAELLSRHLAAEPENVEAWLLMSQAQRGLGQIQESLISAEQATRLAPDDDRVHSARGVVLLDQRRNSSARQAFNEAVQFNPSSYQHWHNRALAEQRVGGLRKEALADIDRALELAPFSAGSHLLRGVILSELGRTKEARVATRKALELDPENALAHNNAAADALEKHRIGSAAAALNRAISADPQHRLVKRNMDALIIKVARRLFFVGIACCWLAAFAAFNDWPFAARHLLVPLFVLAAFAVGLAPLRSLSRGARRYLGRRVLKEPFLLYASTVPLLSGVLALVASELPAAAGRGLSNLFWLFVAANITFALWGRSWVAERRKEDARFRR